MTKFSNQTTILEFLSDSRVWIMSYKIWVRVMDIELWKRSRRDEYFQNEFSIFCSEHGISHQSSALKLLMKKKIVDIINTIILSKEVKFVRSKKLVPVTKPVPKRLKMYWFKYRMFRLIPDVSVCTGHFECYLCFRPI